MKTIAQRTSALLFLLSFIKSFKYSSNSYDIVFIILCACIYLSYEFITEKELKEKVEKLTMETNKRFEENAKDMKDTKNYVSSLSIGSAFKR